MIALATTSVAQAANIMIDDSNPNTITIKITVADFELGFSVDGLVLVPLTGETGPQAEGSITLADGPHTFSGGYQTLDFNLHPLSNAILFGKSGAASSATSSIRISGTADGVFANISGSFDGSTGALYANFGPPTYAQDGSTRRAGLSSLTVQFQSKPAAAVPKPASLVLLGSGLFGLDLTRRRRR